MLLPLISAGASVVARFIAKKGLQAAIKKFTKKAITEGKKHAADLLKKNGGQTAQKAANIKNIKPTQALNANSRSTLRKGLGVGAAAGAVGSAAATAKVLSDKNELKRKKDEANLAKAKREAYEAAGKKAKASKTFKDELARATTKIGIEKAVAKANNKKDSTLAPTSSMKPKARAKSMRPKSRPRVAGSVGNTESTRGFKPLSKK